MYIAKPPHSWTTTLENIASALPRKSKLPGAVWMNVSLRNRRRTLVGESQPSINQLGLPCGSKSPVTKLASGYASVYFSIHVLSRSANMIPLYLHRVPTNDYIDC